LQRTGEQPWCSVLVNMRSVVPIQTSVVMLGRAPSQNCSCATSK